MLDTDLEIEESTAAMFARAGWFSAVLDTDISGGGAPFLTVNGLTVLAETLGKLGFFVPLTMFSGVLLIGRLSFNGINNVFGTIFRCPLSLIDKTKSAKGLDTGCDVLINT